MDEKESILIINNNESIRRSLALILGKKGYETETAGTGQETLEKTQGRFFNLALLDIKLPDMDGTGLIAPLKEKYPDMEVIIATAYASCATAVQALNKGASAYITKPLNTDKVLVKVKELLKKQHLVIENRKLLEALQQELTERKEAENELQESKEKIESLHETARHLEACETEDEVYQLTVEATEQILPFAMCTLVIVEGSELMAKVTSFALPPGSSRESGFDERLARKTYRTGKTYVFGSSDDVAEAGSTRVNFQSGIIAPISDIGVFQAFSTSPAAFTKDDAWLLELLLGHTGEAVRRIRLQNELKEQATRDPLTGLYNRHYLNQALEQEIKRSDRYGNSISFLMIDVNRFKEINDRFGHQRGDKVLQAAASLLLEVVRQSDIVVRYGGDEFLIMLLKPDGEADIVKQRIVEKMTGRNGMNKLVDFPVTLSIGSANWSPGNSEPIDEVLSRADKRMYEDKKADNR